MKRLLDNALTTTKSIASTLRPPLLDDFGLISAIEWIAENFHKRTVISCTVENHDIVIRPGDPAESVIFRIIQESLLNVERHSKASHVNIILRHNDKYLDVIVQGNGIWMAPGHENNPGCDGLITMQERVYILGGKITVQNLEPTGFKIHASVPIDQSTNSSPFL
jgi:signal transduction histidine kinase